MKAPLFALALLAAAAAPAVAAGPAAYPTLVVNGQKIAPERIAVELGSEKHANSALHGGTEAREPGRAVVETVIDRLVVRELLLQESRRRGLAVSAAELAAGWEAEQKRWGSPEVFAKSLAMRGLTVDFLKDRVAEDLLTRKLVREAVDARAVVAESEERPWFERNRELFQKDAPPMLRLIRFDYAKHGGAAGVRARFAEYRRKLDYNVPFAQLAAEYSDHPSARDGGAIGENPDPPVPFIEVGRGLRRSQFSDPQSDDTAYYVFCRDRNPPRHEFEEVRAKVRATMIEGRRKELFSALVADLKGKARIERLP